MPHRLREFSQFFDIGGGSASAVEIYSFFKQLFE
jgi:hypothetical protein